MVWFQVMALSSEHDVKDEEDDPNEVEITRYLTYYYFRKHFESKYVKTGSKFNNNYSIPESIKLLCAKYAGSTIKETTFLSMLKAIGDKINGILSKWHSQSKKNILSQSNNDTKNINNTLYKPKQRKEFVDISKLYGIDWSCDSKYIATCCQSGVIIIWDVSTGLKKLAIKCDAAHCHSVALSPKYDLIAGGGLDNTVTIYSTKDDNNEFIAFCDKKKVEFKDHDGYISRIQFVNGNQQIMASSGDTTCIIWDITKESKIDTFGGHDEDILWFELNKYGDKNIFTTASMDRKVKIWDMRINKYEIGSFKGHTDDVNSVKWFPDGYGLITGSEDGLVKLFDIRCYREMNEYSINETNSMGSSSEVTSVAVSKSGSYIYSAYTNGSVYVWSTIHRGCYHNILDHPSRVSAIEISPDGYGLATACWDVKLRIFA